MKEFMIVCRINQTDENFINKIPFQRFLINNLMAKGDVISYTLSGDRSLLWMVVKATSKQKALSLFNSLPLSPYMDVELHDLLFNNSVFLNEPVFSLN